MQKLIIKKIINILNALIIYSVLKIMTLKKHTKQIPIKYNKNKIKK